MNKEEYYARLSYYHNGYILEDCENGLKFSTRNKTNKLSNTYPHYTDDRFNKAQTIFCLEPEKVNHNRYETIEGLSYEYSDRLQQWDYTKDKQAKNEAQGEKNSANWYESYLRNYHGREVELVHILSGVSLSDGYPYLVFGYRG